MAETTQPPTAFVALGANLGDARANMSRTFDRLQSLSAAPLLRSSVLETAPVDCPPGSPMFLNAVAGLVPRPGETPESLLVQLQALEKEIGRQPKTIPNEPRVIDLDLIAFGGQTRNTAGLVLPHPRAHLRRFVMQPLAEIAPAFVLPGQSRTAVELLAFLPIGKNAEGYRGETIDLQGILREIEQAALGDGWIRDTLPGAVARAAYRKAAAAPRRKVYISAGIHGDEPAGPLAMLRLLREKQWPADLSFWICPCLNPAGMALNRRENGDGIDLNRDYRHLQTGEVRGHVEWLARQPEFDLSLCLHEDWESKGFYLYELTPGGRAPLGEHIIDNVAAVCPVDMSEVIEDWPAQHGVIRPAFAPKDRPQWPEALFLVANNKTHQSCTLEAPSDFPLSTRVNALVAAVRAALEMQTGE